MENKVICSKYSVIRKILPLIHHVLDKQQTSDSPLGNTGLTSLDSISWMLLRDWMRHLEVVGKKRIMQNNGIILPTGLTITTGPGQPDLIWHQNGKGSSKLSKMVTEEHEEVGVGAGQTGLAPKPAMGSSTIMVILLGPPVCRQTGAEESPEHENREWEKERLLI